MTVKHGTYSGYKRGCRCEACRAAYRVRSAEYMRRWRRGKKVRVPAAEQRRVIARLQEMMAAGSDAYVNDIETDHVRRGTK